MTQYIQHSDETLVDKNPLWDTVAAFLNKVARLLLMSFSDVFKCIGSYCRLIACKISVQETKPLLNFNSSKVSIYIFPHC